MKIMDTMAIPGRRRNTYSPEFKREVIAACVRAGASVARVALFYGLNTNVVHRWRREARDTEQTLPAFVPLTLEAATPPAATPTAAADGEIRVELEHSGHRVSISWPLGAAGDCAAFLRALLS
jgi:transposase